MDKDYIKLFLDGWGYWSRDNLNTVGYPSKSPFTLDDTPKNKKATFNFTDDHAQIIEQAVKLLRTYDLLCFNILFYYHVKCCSFSRIAKKLKLSKTSVALEYNRAVSFVGGYLIDKIKI